jgi:hypothetical protein
MRSSSFSITLAAALVGAALAAACGETTPTPAAPTAGPTASAPPAPKPPMSAPPPATTPAPTASAPPPVPTAPAGKPMPAVMATKMGDELKAIGLDPANLPALNKVKGKQLSKVMPLIAKATGMECKGCHVEEGGKLNFKKETRNKTIASHMWTDYVATMALADGGALFCDSCHQGQAEFLDRKNKDATKDFMDANYVKKLARKDKKTQDCTTCHTSDYEMHIFDKLWKAKREAPAASYSLPGVDRPLLGMR